MMAQDPRTDSPLQRVLAYATVICIVLSLAAITAIIVAYSMGIAQSDQLRHGLWPAIVATPMVGFPLGLILMMVLLWTTSLARRARSRAES
ncbi:MAG TPA: hypothetical protein VFQ96_00900 [Microbacteriaceae bacterium]|nr:hypothetical protein [Microbacteriaceae bacterium]